MMPRFSQLRLLSTLVANAALCLPGCGADTDRHAPLLADESNPPAPIQGCEDEAYEICDIRATNCQRQIYSLVACLRGVTDDEPPPIRVLSEDEFREEQALAWVEREEPSPDHYENALVLLGLVVPGAFSQETEIEQRTEDVAAYYSTQTETVTVIDHGLAFDDVDVVPVLAHEFVHAQQDRELNLEALWEAHVTTGDQALGLRSLVEGEAMVYHTLVAASLAGANLQRLDLHSLFEAQAERSMTWLMEQPSPYAVRLSVFPYGTGALYAYLGWREYDPEGLRAEFADPPLSSQRLMASHDAVAPEVGTPLEVAAPTSDAIGSFVTSDVLGALGVRLFLRAEESAAADAVAAAWRGDSLWGYATDGSNGVVWSVAFADSEAAVAFAQFAEHTLGERDVVFRHRVDDTLVTLTVATEDALLDELVAATN
jgi:hypothetical protein